MGVPMEKLAGKPVPTCLACADPANGRPYAVNFRGGSKRFGSDVRTIFANGPNVTKTAGLRTPISISVRFLGRHIDSRGKTLLSLEARENV
jgi:hypothetical protein